MAASIVDLSLARATRRKSPDPHAPANPRFVVRHTWPCRYELVDVQASSTAKSVVADCIDFEAAKAERDRRNAEHWAQAAQ